MCAHLQATSLWPSRSFAKANTKYPTSETAFAYSDNRAKENQFSRRHRHRSRIRWCEHNFREVVLPPIPHTLNGKYCGTKNRGIICVMNATSMCKITPLWLLYSDDNKGILVECFINKSARYFAYLRFGIIFLH